MRKGSSFAFCMKCSRDINLERGGTRDHRRHQETKLHKHSEKYGVGVLPLQSYFGSIREESNPCRSTLHIFPWRGPSGLSIGKSLYQTIQVDVS